jgi:hypothetical protein
MHLLIVLAPAHTPAKILSSREPLRCNVLLTTTSNRSTWADTSHLVQDPPATHLSKWRKTILHTAKITRKQVKYGVKPQAPGVEETKKCTNTLCQIDTSTTFQNGTLVDCCGTIIIIVQQYSTSRCNKKRYYNRFPNRLVGSQKRGLLLHVLEPQNMFYDN